MPLNNCSLRRAHKLEQKLDDYTELETAYLELIELMFNDQLQAIERE